MARTKAELEARLREADRALAAARGEKESVHAQLMAARRELEDERAKTRAAQLQAARYQGALHWEAQRRDAFAAMLIGRSRAEQLAEQ
jgi:hypothetical protein